ncbi:MAG: GNAT family N-acetyltransferase, partial [Chlamydiia bacterium]|nr:GNAT family N-acetyltransferase [Chlamydiia bacterium]
DAPRLLELYSKLYIGKHSRCNVMFKQSFVERALRHRLLNFLALERDGRIDAVMAYVQNDRMVYTPFIGYDLELPQDLGLYRMASALLVKQALDLGLAVNHSAGAARFKKNRGAHGVIEQHYVFTEHLPTYRQAGWRVLRQIMNRLAVPMVKRMAI